MSTGTRLDKDHQDLSYVGNVDCPAKSSAKSYCLARLSLINLFPPFNNDDDAVRLNEKEKYNIPKKILEAGADVYAYRISGGIPGVTALDHLLCFENYSAEQLELFVKLHGARLNGYNPLDEGGYLAVAFLSRGTQSEKKKILFDAMLKYPRTIEADERGRTVIHSLAAHPGMSLDVNEYVQLIDELAGIVGCDVDDQDEKVLEININK